MVQPIFNHFVPIFLREKQLSATLIMFVMTWDNYINIFLQPIVGTLSCRIRTRFHRRKPWVMAGAPVAGRVFLLYR